MLGMMNILADGWGDMWMPPQASSQAGDIDWLFYVIFGICLFFFVLVCVLLVVFAIKYRYREGQEEIIVPRHSNALELTWTFIPTVIVFIIFYYGFRGYMDMVVAPPNAYEITVQAVQWGYTFDYPNGHADGTLHVPADMPVRLLLNSVDVLHGFYVPAFRVKKDIVPGRVNTLWFQANPPSGKSASYDVYCTQYCGRGHSEMRAVCVVQSQTDFVNWLANADAGLTPVERGKLVYARSCALCHSIDGTIIKAPTWKDLYGSTVKFQDGTSEKADDDYLKFVITHANAKPIPGFDPIMPNFNAILRDKDVLDVIAFIKSDSKYYHPVTLGATTKPAGQTAASATQPSK